jgi:hypothetical protein
LAFDYEGVRNGQTKNDRSAVAFDALASDHSVPYTIVGDKGPDMYVMRAAESYFLRQKEFLRDGTQGQELLKNFITLVSRCRLMKTDIPTI